jgi:hypothetical protein
MVVVVLAESFQHRPLERLATGWHYRIPFEPAVLYAGDANVRHP